MAAESLWMIATGFAKINHDQHRQKIILLMLFFSHFSLVLVAAILGTLMISNDTQFSVGWLYILGVVQLLVRWAINLGQFRKFFPMRV
jgi:hypothetical protein